MARKGPAGDWLSLRKLSVVLLVALALLVILPVLALAEATVLMRAAERTQTHGVEAIRLISAMERALRQYQLVSNSLVVMPSPRLAKSRNALAEEITGMFSALERHVTEETQCVLLEELDSQVETYLRQRRLQESASDDLEEILHLSSPYLDEALQTTATLLGLSRHDMRQAQRQAEEMLDYSLALGVGSSLLLLLAFASLVLGVQRRVLRPVLELEEAVGRFRRGEAAARAPSLGPRELKSLSISFNEMAETIDQQRREQLGFLAGVAHDFRAPLSTLKMTIDVMQEDPGALSRENLMRMDRQVERLGRMTEDLLFTARAEAGGIELRPEDADLTELARNVVEKYAGETTIHQVGLRAPEQPVRLRCDPVRVEQALGNLIGNAIKYSPEGGPIDVVVSVEGKEAVVSVRDRGMGIAPDQIPLLFVPFRRGRAAGGPIPGAGLGLSIVRRIALAHGGRIEVDSEPGEGSTFRLHLPVEGPKVIQSDEQPAGADA